MQDDDGALGCGAQVVHHALKVEADALRLKIPIPLPLHARVREDVLPHMGDSAFNINLGPQIGIRNKCLQHSGFRSITYPPKQRCCELHSSKHALC